MGQRGVQDSTLMWWLMTHLQHSRGPSRDQPRVSDVGSCHLFVRAVSTSKASKTPRLSEIVYAESHSPNISPATQNDHSAGRWELIRIDNRKRPGTSNRDLNPSATIAPPAPESASQPASPPPRSPYQSLSKNSQKTTWSGYRDRSLLERCYADRRNSWKQRHRRRVLWVTRSRNSCRSARLRESRLLHTVTSRSAPHLPKRRIISPQSAIAVIVEITRLRFNSNGVPVNFCLDVVVQSEAANLLNCRVNIRAPTVLNPVTHNNILEREFWLQTRTHSKLVRFLVHTISNRFFVFYDREAEVIGFPEFKYIELISRTRY